MTQPREFYGRWKYSKRADAWVWKWKRRKVRQVDTPPHNPLEHMNLCNSLAASQESES